MIKQENKRVFNPEHAMLLYSALFSVSDLLFLLKTMIAITTGIPSKISVVKIIRALA